MAIEYNENGFRILNIPASGHNAGKKLQDINAYITCLNEPSYATSNIDAFGCYTDPYRFVGQYISTDNDTFGVILGHEFNPFIYRGENDDYKHFKPSALRFEFSKEGEQVRHCINFIKKQEFLQLFKETPYYNRCEQFRVLNCKFRFDFEAIAQHYEFISNYIDITKDLGTALFFAYTYQENGKYYPITDFDKYHPTLYIGNLKNIYAQNSKAVKIIGFQSLLRPYLQKAMAIEIKEEDKVKPLFEKITLPPNKAMAYNAYTRFLGGEALFPNDYMSIMAKEVKNRITLNSDYFEIYCKEYNLDQEDLKTQIKNLGYDLSETKWGIYEHAKYLINRELDDEILPLLNERIGFRSVAKNFSGKGIS